jgi:hypothetical protein
MTGELSFGTAENAILGVLAEPCHRNVACLESLLNGNGRAMHQDSKTLTVLFAPHTQQLAILDITHHIVEARFRASTFFAKPILVEQRYRPLGVVKYARALIA